MTVWINTDDTNWSRDGAFFENYDEAKKCAAFNAKEWEGSEPIDIDQLLGTLDEIEIESADASEIEDIEREIRITNSDPSAACLAAIAARKKVTHDE